MTWEVGKIVEKFNEQNVLWYLEKGLMVTGHQCWLTKISNFETTLFIFYGGRRWVDQETARETVVFDVNKTFDGLSIASWTKRTSLHLKYVKEVVMVVGPIVKSTGSGVYEALYIKKHIKSSVC